MSEIKLIINYYFNIIFLYNKVSKKKNKYYLLLDFT